MMPSLWQRTIQRHALDSSSYAARAADMLSQGSPRSSFFLPLRWLLTHWPSAGSSTQTPGTLQSPCSRLYAASLAKFSAQADSCRSKPLARLAASGGLGCLGPSKGVGATGPRSRRQGCSPGGRRSSSVPHLGANPYGE